jgi:hypothetical protein
MIFMIVLGLLLLLLEHALAHAIFFIIFKRQVQILDLIFLVKLHVVSNRWLLLEGILTASFVEIATLLTVTSNLTFLL